MVTVIKCTDYNTDGIYNLLSSHWDGMGLPDPKGATVLLKPNILRAASPDLAVTTHPAFVSAVIRLYRKLGAKKILVGDSPGWQPSFLAATTSGILEACKNEGAEFRDFADAVSVENPQGVIVKRFNIARAVAEADMVISLPKLKTHGLMYFTGAAKNLFGVIPGIQKSAFHMRFPGRHEFGIMLSDLVLALKPAGAFMDAITGMEGPGPNSGKPKDLGFILASENVFEMDWLASEIIGYNPLDIPYLAVARENPVYGFSSRIKTIGANPAQVKPDSFELVSVLKENDFFRKHLPSWMYLPLKNLMVARPVFSEKKCIRCQACIKICPVDALALTEKKNAPVPDYSKCIRCYCCHEVCPVDAIDLKRGWF